MLLSLACALLLWRVLRLEATVYATQRDQIEALGREMPREARLLNWENEVLCRCTAATEQRVRALARALGYEWKRTDAKEGWERSAVASVKPDAPKNPFGVGDMFSYYKALDAYLKPISPVGMDRRKADRRKPGFPEVDESVSWDLGTGKKTFTRTKKKPRRAH